MNNTGANAEDFFVGRRGTSLGLYWTALDLMRGLQIIDGRTGSG